MKVTVMYGLDVLMHILTKVFLLSVSTIKPTELKEISDFSFRSSYAWSTNRMKYCFPLVPNCLVTKTQDLIRAFYFSRVGFQISLKKEKSLEWKKVFIYGLRITEWQIFETSSSKTSNRSSTSYFSILFHLYLLALLQCICKK